MKEIEGAGHAIFGVYVKFLLNSVNLQLDPKENNLTEMKNEKMHCGLSREFLNFEIYAYVYI